MPVHFADSSATQEQSDPSSTRKFGFVRLGCAYETVLTVDRDPSAIAVGHVSKRHDHLFHVTIEALSAHDDSAAWDISFGGGRPGEGSALRIALLASTEGRIHETVAVTESASGGQHLVTLEANVISHKKGTPALRPGIRCTASHGEDSEGEQTEWQGFQDS
eukprot:TRINITY_DN1149_c0_g1_i1.p2 TRINITY_DN1149_c0_g1~~TRINITY_DN1149_c0_g1_i1.p2  ORF type:complete len:162 (+),score=24.19 TRINITY_DN1149_c0_g1_i1:444-929(+)